MLSARCRNEQLRPEGEDGQLQLGTQHLGSQQLEQTSEGSHLH